MVEALETKAALRGRMRSERRALDDRVARSESIWRRVESLDAVRSAEVVMAFDSIPGEPVTAPFVARRRAAGQSVVLPEDDPRPDPAGIDVVVVPGTAFTRRGERLGQGGGWYDRFLLGVREHCVTIGVGFEIQIVDELPVEPHDIVLDAVITECDTYWREAPDAS